MLREGDVAAGRYKLQALIGEGAMGEVWRAEDQTLRRLVAIKFLFVRGARDPQAMVDQFLREARIAASVQHRNVIHTVDFGTIDGAQPYMVMELLDGLSLAERMDRNPPLALETFLHLINLTLRGLAAVHAAGIVHRDLKPANIFLQNDTDGVLPKILDFGISRSLEGEERRSAISTQQGLIVGTPDYMSPEQARGDGDIDKRSDIYSMGAILYEGMTGQLPFQANAVGELIALLVTSSPPPIKQVRPEIPELLSDVVEQAMARDRQERFMDAGVMRNALLAAANKCLPAASRVSVTPHTRPAVPQRAPANQVEVVSVATPLPRTAAGQGPGQAESGWGGFEGLGGSTPRGDGISDLGVASRRGSLASLPTAAPGPVSLPDAPSMASARPGAASDNPQRSRLGASGTHLGAMPSRAGLDSLRSPSAGTGKSLEIDYDRGTEHLKHRRADTGVRRRRVPRPRKRSNRWLAPVLLALAIGALTVGPSFVLRRFQKPIIEAEPSMMEDPDRGVTPARRRSPARHPPALRDVMFE